MATLAEADVRRLLKEYHWVPADEPPTVPGGITPKVPKGAEWRTSEEFSAEVTRNVHTASFPLDPRARIVVFAAVNPTPAQGS
ncbi:hypothetical protein [Streptomyces sp. NPDC002825]|uniref:hypothetical protein n=1 Tax=Streptomyces sp. NPDC002825 TaxID=3154666 RepID=UPI00333352F7